MDKIHLKKKETDGAAKNHCAKKIKLLRNAQGSKI